MTNALLEKIKTRGYWRVVLRPVIFEAEKLPKLSAVEAAVVDSHVELRGWDYPHIGNNNIAYKADHIEGTADWAEFHEVWRAYQSGQFVHVFGMREDWWKEGDFGPSHIDPGTVLSLSSTLYTMTEIFLFAARFSERAQLRPEVILEWRLHGLSNRQLQTFDTNRVPLADFRRAASDLPAFGNSLKIETEQLIIDAPQYAVDQTMRLYERFHWEPSRETVIEEQRRFMERRYF